MKDSTKWQFLRKRSKSGSFQANFKILKNADHTEAKRGRCFLDINKI